MHEIAAYSQQCHHVPSVSLPIDIDIMWNNVFSETNRIPLSRKYCDPVFSDNTHLNALLRGKLMKNKEEL